MSCVVTVALCRAGGCGLRCMSRLAQLQLLYKLLQCYSCVEFGPVFLELVRLATRPALSPSTLQTEGETPQTERQSRSDRTVLYDIVLVCVDWTNPKKRVRKFGTTESERGRLTLD